jgi:sporulation protein YlmC with PRC-barrel domain
MEESKSILAQIKIGMHIVDSDGHKIGKVRNVHLGGKNKNQGESSRSTQVAGGGATTAGSGEGYAVHLTNVDTYKDAVDGDELFDKTLRERLKESGFVQVDMAGLFSADRFIIPEQIASVSKKEIKLSVTKDHLIKAA